MPIKRASLTVLLLTTTAFAAPKRVSPPRHTHLISIGAYAAPGSTIPAQPGNRPGLDVQAGIFADYARHNLRPGLDARFARQNFGIPSPVLIGNATERLIGPRLSYAHGIAHPYVEALFGKGHGNNIPPSDNDPTIYATGLARYGVAGIDLDLATHLQFRLEYAAGTIGGQQGFLIQNATAGLVVRFP